MNIKRKTVEIKEAHVNNYHYRKEIWKIFNENLEFTNITDKPVSYKDHCKWWEKIFNFEYIYIILCESEICGYIRITKVSTKNKEKNEISIALSKKYHNKGIGSYAYSLFEEEIKRKGIKRVVANTLFKNKKGIKFFKSNDFVKTHIKFIKKLT